MTPKAQRIAIAKWVGMDTAYVESVLPLFANRDDGGNAVLTLARMDVP